MTIHADVGLVAVDDLKPWPRNPLVELDPRFVDVICARWQKHTGDLPVRAGEPVDFLEGGSDGDSSGLEA